MMAVRSKTDFEPTVESLTTLLTVIGPPRRCEEDDLSRAADDDISAAPRVVLIIWFGRSPV